MNRLMLEHCGCKEIRDRLSEYIDEELGALDRARVVLHLAACPRCRETALGLAQTVLAVHRLLGCRGRGSVHRLH